MKEGLIDTIKSHGYWRVNFQPVVLKEKIEFLKDARQIVEKNQVKLLGWYYPLTVIHKDDKSDYENGSNFFQAWIDWGEHKEFWRMYLSAQFLCYKAFREDWFHEPTDWPLRYNIDPDIKFGVLICIYEITQIYEFLSRLCLEGLYDEGVVVNISIYNLYGRTLWLEDGGRMPFSYPRTTSASNIEITKQYSKNQVVDNSTQLSNEVILKIFDHFDWNPTKEQILVDQNKLLNGLV